MFSKIYNTELKINYNPFDDFNRYAFDISAEYNQSVEEGLDIEEHKALFEAVQNMKLRCPIKKRFEKSFSVHGREGQSVAY